MNIAEELDGIFDRQDKVPDGLGLHLGPRRRSMVRFRALAGAGAGATRAPHVLVVAVAVGTEAGAAFFVERSVVAQRSNRLCDVAVGVAMRTDLVFRHIRSLDLEYA